MGTTTKLLTYEEWVKLPTPNDVVEEVLDGEVRVLPPNHINHAYVIEDLSFRFASAVDRRKVRVLSSVFGLVISRQPLRTRVPDLALLKRDNIVEVDGFIHSAPELIVEVLSPSNWRIDRTEKLQDYARIGVPEVWFVSPEAQSIEVFELTDGKLESVRLINRGRLAPKLFPEAAIEIEQIWPR